MRKLLGLLAALALFSAHGAMAQTAVTVLPGGCGTAAVGTSGASGGNLAQSGRGQNSIFVDTTGSLCTNGGGAGTSAVNLTQVGGVTLLRGAGATGTGSERVTVAQDTTTIAGSAPGTAGSASANVVTIQGVASMTPVQVTQSPATSGGLSVFRKQVANNTTSFAVDASPGQLYGIEAFNNGSTIAYVKLYNAAQGSTTCGSGTPVYQGMIPAPTAGGGGYISMNVQGLAFSTAITACVTTGFADADTTAPAASTYVLNFFYK